MKYWKNFKLAWSQAPKPPSRNYTLAIAVKKHATVDIKLFLSCPILNILSRIAVFILVQTRTFYSIEST